MALSDRNRDSLTEAWRHLDWLMPILPPLADAPPSYRSGAVLFNVDVTAIAASIAPFCGYDPILRTDRSPPLQAFYDVD